MTNYLNDQAHLALCEAIADSDVLCEALDIPADPIVGMPTTERVAFELGARFDLWAERYRPVLELETLLEGIRDVVRVTMRKRVSAG